MGTLSVVLGSQRHPPAFCSPTRVSLSTCPHPSCLPRHHHVYHHSLFTLVCQPAAEPLPLGGRCAWVDGRGLPECQDRCWERRAPFLPRPPATRTHTRQAAQMAGASPSALRSCSWLRSPDSWARNVLPLYASRGASRGTSGSRLRPAESREGFHSSCCELSTLAASELRSAPGRRGLGSVTIPGLVQEGSLAPLLVWGICAWRQLWPPRSNQTPRPLLKTQTRTEWL